MTPTGRIQLPQHQSHPREWRDNLYVYPVISRRSGGVSIGVNLNPDAACNFDCVYCQVDRSQTPRVREVDPRRLEEELNATIEVVRSGRLFEDNAFAEVPPAFRGIRDIAFSGDGEPTTCRQFNESVDIAVRLRRKAGLLDAKIVLITDACYLTKPNVVAALAVMDENNGEIWAKLDAGTEEYYQRVNRPNYPLSHVIENIIAAARIRPVVIQALFMRLNGVGPDEAELVAFTDQLTRIISAGGRLKHVQVYTVARPPAEAYVSALSDEQIDHIAALVSARTDLPVEAYYGPAAAAATGSSGPLPQGKTPPN